MGQSFDPYYNWLGIPEAEQPPNYYRLLGLAPLEANLSVIEHAADRAVCSIRLARPATTPTCKPAWA
jgi:hypothetical protein